MINRLTFALLLLFASPAWGQPAPAEEAKPEPIKGRWLVHHADKFLGKVSGRAVIDEGESRARVTLTHPATGTDYVLRSKSLTRDGDSITIELEGFWPGADDIREAPLGASIDVTGSIAPPEGAAIGNMALGEDREIGSDGAIKLDDLMASYRGSETSLDVYKPGFPDLDSVTLKLTLSGDSMIGTWSYKADSQTGRDRKGNGRMGDFTFTEDGSGDAEQSGPEVWHRPKPVIRVTMPAYDQTRIKQYGIVAYPYPWKKNGSLVKPLTDRRYILIAGENLPQKLGEGAKFTSPDDKIKYYLQAKKPDFGETLDDNPMVVNALERVRKQMYQRARLSSPDKTVSIEQADKIAETMKALRKQDMIIVRVELQQGAVPGLKGFTIDGTETSWVLRYGDFNADFSFVRPVFGAETDPLDYAFAPERVQIELRTEMDMPFDQIPVQVWVKSDKKDPKTGKDKYLPHVFDGSRNIMAVRLPTTEEDEEALALRKAEARRAGVDPDEIKQIYRYRTAPILLVDDAAQADASVSLAPDIKGDWRVPVKTGSKLRAMIGNITVKEKGKKAKVDSARYWVNTAPGMAEIGIVSAPADVAQFTLEDDNTSNLTWNGALREAAQCADIEVKLPLNWERLARQKAHTFTNVIIKHLEVRENTMRIGDHAAMIMLRDVFLESQQRQLNNLAAIDSFDEIMDFRENSRVPVQTLENHPLASLEVAAPNGEMLSYEHSFWEDHYLAGKYGLTSENLDTWRAQMTLDVIRQYRESIQGSIDIAKNVSTCDKDDKEDELVKLMSLTANGFSAMQRYAIARAVNTDTTADQTGAEWKADRIARAYLLGVPTFAGAVQSQQSLSAADTKIMVMSVAIGTSIAGAGAGVYAYFAATTYEATALLTLATVIDVLSTVDSVTETVTGKIDSVAEVNFAKGATASLGMGRLQNALASDEHWAAFAFALYLDIAPELIGFDLHGFVKGPLSLLPSGKRLVSTAEAVADGKRLLGAVDAGAEAAEEAAEAASELAENAGQIADSFPTRQGMDDALAIDFDDFAPPARPTTDAPAAPTNTMPEADDLTPTRQIPPSEPPSGTANATTPEVPNAPDSPSANDTVIETPSANAQPASGTPSNAGDDTIIKAPASPPPAAAAPNVAGASDTIIETPGGAVGDATVMDAPTPSATLPAPDYTMRNPQNVADLPAIRTEVDAAYAQTKAYAQEAYEQGRQLTRTEIANLEFTAQAANTQDLIESAVSEARRAGVPDSEINKLMSSAAGNNAMETRLIAIRELEFAAVEKLGYDVVMPDYADTVLELMTRAEIGPLSQTDLNRLKQLIEEAADQGKDLFQELERQGTFSFHRYNKDGSFNPGEGFELLGGPDDIATLRRFAEQNDLSPDLTSTQVTSNTSASQPQVNSVEDIRALPKPQRNNVFAAMVEARNVARNLGEGVLDASEQAALRLSRQASGETSGLPGWAQGIGRDTYNRLRHLSRRADVHKLGLDSPGEL